MPGKSLPLQDLLRLAFADPVIWINGREGAARYIRWATTIRDDLQPGDLLLLPADQLSAGLLNHARERGATAVLIIGEAQLPDGADPAELALVSIPAGGQDLRSIQHLILTILISERAALVERGARIHTQLLQLEAEGKGLAGLARAMADLSGRGVLIQDKRGQILAESPSSTLHSIWGDILEQLAALESLPETLVDRKRAVGQRTAAVQPVPGGLERLVIPIIVGEMARGYLSLVGLAGELDELDYLVVEHGEQVCAIEMARAKAVREAEKRLKGDLLTALLKENLSPRDARLWVQAMGLDLSQAHVALRFAWDAPSPPSRRRLETIINGEVARLDQKVIVSPMGSEVICFCQVPTDENRPEPALSLSEAVLEQVAREYPHTPGRCGLGLPAPDLADWHASFRQAGQALEMARRLGESKPLFYADLSVYRLLFQLEHSPELIAFQEETLGPLLANDGAAEFIHTLEAYFEHNGNLSQTADALFVHRNTLVYRLERIETITSLDLDKPENRLAIQLALRIHRMMHGKLG
jgi:purine catabolism regulator